MDVHRSPGERDEHDLPVGSEPSSAREPAASTSERDDETEASAPTDHDDENAAEQEAPAPLAEDDAVESLRDLVVYLAERLTDAPEAVEVVAERRGSMVHLNLRVPEEELGKVIGRQGRIARAMRTALAITGSRYQLRATLDIDD